MRTIHEIASTVRVFTERHGSWPADLNGACASSAWLLIRLLREQGHYPRLSVGVFDDYKEELETCDCTHAWVTLHTETIVDVTATQFGKRYPRVVVAKRGSKIWKKYTELASDDEAEQVILGTWGWSPESLTRLSAQWTLEKKAFVKEPEAVAIEV